MVFLARALRFLQRGKTLVVMAVLAPAVLTLAMGSLALLRTAPPTVPTQPTPTQTALSMIESTPTPRVGTASHGTRGPKSPRQHGSGHNMR